MRVANIHMFNALDELLVDFKVHSWKKVDVLRRPTLAAWARVALPGTYIITIGSRRSSHALAVEVNDFGDMTWIDNQRQARVTFRSVPVGFKYFGPRSRVSNEVRILN